MSSLAITHLGNGRFSIEGKGEITLRELSQIAFSEEGDTTIRGQADPQDPNQFRAWVAHQLGRFNLEGMHGFDLRSGVSGFLAEVADKESVEDWVTEASRYLLHPIGLMLVHHYASRIVRIESGRKPDRFGYEAFYHAVENILRAYARLCNEAEPFFPLLDEAGPKAKWTVVAREGTLRARTVRRDDNRGQAFVFWVLRPEKLGQDGQVIRPAEIIIW